MSTKCQRRGVGGPSNVNVDRNKRRNKRSTFQVARFFIYVTLVFLSRGDSVIRLNFVYYFAKMFIDSIGGHFPYVNVDIRGVVLSMSTHVNERGQGVKKRSILVNVNCERPLRNQILIPVFEIVASYLSNLKNVI